MEALGDGEIVGGAARLAAQPLEREDGDALQALGHVQRAPAADVELLGWAPWRDPRPDSRSGGRRPRSAPRSLPARWARATRRTPRRRCEAVVGRAVDREHVEALLDQVDERQEQLAVEPVLVEVARRAVGRGDDASRLRSSRVVEQPRQDHRVGGVVDDHLVEAEQLRLVGDVVRRRARSDRLPRSLAPSRSRAWVSSMKAWKWTRRFGCDVDMVEARSISIDLPRPTPPHR